MKYKTNRARIKDAYHSVFNSVSGKIVLQHLAKVCGLGNTSVVKGDVYETYVNEGMRRVILSILRQLNVDDAAMMGLIEQGIQEEMKPDDGYSIDG